MYMGITTIDRYRYNACVCVCTHLLHHTAVIIHFQHVEFGMRLTSCLGLDEAVSSLLSGEFACDAVITRAQQLTRQEVSSGI